MDRAGAMELVVAVVESGGFTAAGQRLGLTPSAVSKAVTRLEARLGVRLFERTTRRLALTQEGASYVEAARRILAEIDGVEQAVTASRTEARGLVRVNASVAFAVHHLAAALPAFRARWPEVAVDLTVSDARVDPVLAHVDVTIRTGPVGDDRLVGRKFAETNRIIAASPAYLAAHGAPTAPDDLARHACINLTSSRDLALWAFRTPEGVRTIDTTGSILVDNAVTSLALGLAGIGVVRLGDIILGEAIREGRMIPLLVDRHVAAPAPLHLVFLPGRQRLPRVRAFLDFVSETFGASPWRLAL
jgi:DNA-binding transcriptional LysR family regulator